MAVHPLDPALDTMLCLALHTAARSITARYRPLLAELGLTYPQYMVLFLLWNSGPASVGGIGAQLGLESSTLSPLLKRLEASGLVTRTRSVEDERTVVVALTDAGRRLRGRGTHAWEQVCVSTGLDDAARAEMITELRDLADRLDRSTAAGDATTR